MEIWLTAFVEDEKKSKPEIIAFIVRIGYSIAAANMPQSLEDCIGYKYK
jgi:hypothetical protein